MDAESGGAMWDLYLAFIDRAGGTIGRAQYNPDLFESATITHMLQDLQIVMNAVTADPGHCISILPPMVLGHGGLVRRRHNRGVLLRNGEQPFVIHLSAWL